MRPSYSRPRHGDVPQDLRLRRCRLRAKYIVKDESLSDRVFVSSSLYDIRP